MPMRTRAHGTMATCTHAAHLPPLLAGVPNFALALGAVQRCDEPLATPSIVPCGSNPEALTLGLGLALNLILTLTDPNHKPCKV